MKVIGIVKRIWDEVSGVSARTGNAWRRKDFLLEYYKNESATFANRVKMGVMNDRVDGAELDLYSEVEVDFDLNAREYNGQLYNDIIVNAVRKVKKEGEGEEPKGKPSDAGEGMKAGEGEKPKGKPSDAGEGKDAGEGMKAGEGKDAAEMTEEQRKAMEKAKAFFDGADDKGKEDEDELPF